MKISGMSIYAMAALAAVMLFSCSKQNDSSAVEGKVFFVEPVDGAEITGKVKVVMGVEGMKVHPAGEIVPGTGHHHIIINGDAADKGSVVPADETHKHFGKGQTETELELAPGKYKLTLQFADGNHQSYGPELSQSIHITVK